MRMTGHTIATIAERVFGVQIDTVLVKVASRCNINCSYCYVYNMGDDGWRDMPTLISRDTASALARALGQLSTDQAKPFATVLHGGEPLMLGERRLEFILKSLRSVLPQSHVLCMQTNGMLLTNNILDLCASYGMSISISLDGPKKINDRFRIDKKGEGTHDKVISGIKKLRDHKASEFLYSGLLSVIDPTSDPIENYNYFKSLEAPSVDFLYRDGNHSNLPFGKNSIDSTEYANWLCRLLDAYLKDKSPPKIRFLDDIIKLRLGGRGIKEGLGQSDYGIVIIETDGSIAKNDTLKSTFDGADKFEHRWSIHKDRLLDVLRTDEFKVYHELQRATSKTCLDCEFFKICGGGMPLHRWKDTTGYDNPSVYCVDQKELIKYIEFYLKKERLIN